MDLVGYARVSTDGQAADGVSLAAQRERIEAYCKAGGSELVGFHEDRGLSGGRADNRPGLQAAVDEACRGKAALVVYSLSRVARSTTDTLAIAEKLDRAGGDLVSLTEKIDTTTAAGAMVFRMLAVLSEFERDLVSERTTAALAHLRGQGRRVSGRIPFGFDLGDDGKSLVENPDEQKALRVIDRLRDEGLSLRGIAAELGRRGIATKMGAPWAAETVRKILTRKVA